ncbi:MAG: outer membrane protein transport protein [Gammaproteobacteria bacterium]|nr:outer membrane protein transport protein [Gammaproteobacteria bacterium]
MKTTKRRLISAAPILLCLCSQGSHAGGLWLFEFGAPEMGRAAAGAETGVDSAAAGLYNPAAMSRASGTQIMATGGIISSRAEFDVDNATILNGTGDGGDAGSVSPAASLFYTRPIDDRWRFGTNVYALSGAALDYDSDWAGRYQATEVEILLLGVVPTVSYRVNDWITLGGNAVLSYTELDLKVAVPNPTTPLAGPDGRAKIDGDDTTFGYGLGVLFEPSDQTRIGIVYQSELEPEYSGDASLDPIGLEVGIDTKLPLAAFFRVGVSHDFDDSFTGHVTLGWEDWSTLDAVNLSTESNAAVLDRNWEDTYHVAVGGTWRMSSEWVVQAGIGYDTSPVDADDRTADLPIDRQVRYAFGMTRYLPSGLEVSGSLVYADYGDAEIDAPGFQGEYESNDLLFVSFSFNWRT